MSGAVVEQDVSVGLVQAAACLDVIFGLRVRCLRSGMSCSWHVLFHKFPEPLCLQGTSSNFLVLRIKARKTIRVSHALWGPASPGKEGLKEGPLSY